VSVAAPAPRTAAPRRAARPAATSRKPRAVERRRRGVVSGAVLWVVLLAALFGGIVALNVAALRGTIDANRLEVQLESVRTENSALAAEVAEKSGFWRIASLAESLGMVPAKPSRGDYIPFRHRAKKKGAVTPGAAGHPAAGRPAHQ
jgi:hypothetical protein